MVGKINRVQEEVRGKVNRFQVGRGERQGQQCSKEVRDKANSVQEEVREKVNRVQEEPRCKVNSVQKR